MAIDEWLHEAYNERKKSFPAALTSDCFNRSRRSDNSDEVSRIKFKAWNTKWKLFYILKIFMIFFIELLKQPEP